MAAVSRATVLLRLCLCPVLRWQNIPSLRFSNLDRPGFGKERFFACLVFVFSSMDQEMDYWVLRGKRGLALMCVQESGKAGCLVHCLPGPGTPASPKLLGRVGWALQPLLPHLPDGAR